MHILEHRGGWLDEKNKLQRYQKNSIDAFKSSFLRRNGIELDIREFDGELVISHELPVQNNVKLETIFNLYKDLASDVMLALNIKSDGLCSMLKNLLLKYNIKKYFAFDMSFPDTMEYYLSNVKFFLRVSDLESECKYFTTDLFKQSSGILIDQFYKDSFSLANNDFFSKVLKTEKKICIISPELHPWGRDSNNYIESWRILRNELNLIGPSSDEIYLCTDYPELADNYFK
jgi:hypothetical protein